jgi:hypothetical protein
MPRNNAKLGHRLYKAQSPAVEMGHFNLNIQLKPIHDLTKARSPLTAEQHLKTSALRFAA